MHTRLLALSVSTAHFQVRLYFQVVDIPGPSRRYSWLASALVMRHALSDASVKEVLSEGSLPSTAAGCSGSKMSAQALRVPCLGHCKAAQTRCIWSRQLSRTVLMSLPSVVQGLCYSAGASAWTIRT